MLRKARTVPTVLVTDAGRGSALAFIRSLGRKGWRVIAADCRRESLGFLSQYATETLLYPSPADSPAAFVQTVHATACKRGVDLVVPITDTTILPLSQARSRLESVCRLAVPEASALAAVSDKAQTVKLARRLGVPVPRTRLVATVEEALRHGPELGWPVVLKPQVSKQMRSDRAIEAFYVCYAQDSRHLAEQMGRLEGRCQVLLQEYRQGAAQGVELLMYRGRPLAAFQHRRIREVPLTGGPSAMRESVPLDPVLYDHSIRLLGEISWTGLAMVEFKGDSRQASLMEINGRVWGSMPLAVHSGMDFPARLAELWLFGPPPAECEPALSYKVGVRARSLELELAWIASVLLGRRRVSFLPPPPRREAISAFMELFHPARKFDVLSLEDPAPGLGELLAIVGKFAGKFGALRS
ncbi:MAG: ATP-grasp domain-containing protein [Pirellulales bacterium]|nr:ATP-grasp domain-containing protein [Pirellulales bacterium]